MNNVEKILTLKALPRVGNAKINKQYTKLLDMDDEQFWDALTIDFADFDLLEAKHHMENVLNELKQQPEIKVLTIKDAEYPNCLNDLGANRPTLLFYKGSLDILKNVCIGIIGTRHPDDYVVKHAPSFIKQVVNNENITIVSGLALGCDAIAHNAALNLKIPTVAVLPSGLNNITPKRNLKLLNDILEQDGLIITEYEPSVAANTFTPVQRDAIIAALSERIISLQCGSKSGTMQTLKAGYNINRILGCYMPSVMEGDFEGHKIAINSLKAISISKIEDIADFLSIKLSKPVPSEQMTFI